MSKVFYKILYIQKAILKVFLYFIKYSHMEKYSERLFYKVLLSNKCHLLYQNKYSIV